jgi:hypothetical protein
MILRPTDEDMRAVFRDQARVRGGARPSLRSDYRRTYKSRPQRTYPVGGGGGAGADCSCPFAGAPGSGFETFYRPLTPDQVGCIPLGGGNFLRIPQWFWGMQDANTALVDAVNGLALTGVGAVQYGGNAVTGWTVTGGDKWFRCSSETVSQGAYVDKDTVPMIGWNIAASLLVFFYVCIESATAERVYLVLSGGTESVYIAIPAAGTFRIYDGTTSNAIGSTVFENATPTVVAGCLLWDVRPPGRMRLFVKRAGAPGDTITTASWAMKPDGGKGINVDVGAAPPICRTNLMWAYNGDDAEWAADLGGAGLGPATIVAAMMGGV